MTTPANPADVCDAIGPHHGDRCLGGHIQSPNAQFTQDCAVCGGTGVKTADAPREPVQPSESLTFETWDDTQEYGYTYRDVWHARDDEVAALKARIAELERENAKKTREVEWRCFHCGDTFTKEQLAHAREHFGRDEGEIPVCLMRVPGESGLIAALRKAQDELASWRAECDPLTRAIEAQAADYEQRLIREEEKGYARGLKDYTKVEAERDRLKADLTELHKRTDDIQAGAGRAWDRSVELERELAELRAACEPFVYYAERHPNAPGSGIVNQIWVAGAERGMGARQPTVNDCRRLAALLATKGAA